MKQALVHYKRKKSKEKPRDLKETDKKIKILKQIKETWENKPLLGQYP